MATEVLTVSSQNPEPAAIARAVDVLRRGALVVFPTETVYGVGANVANPDAMMRLRTAKGRDVSQPFTVHLGRRSDARFYLTNPSPVVRRLARKLWPGPVTLVCHEPTPAQTEVAKSVPAEQLSEIYHDGMVGLRVPDHAAAMELLARAETPIVASSANRTGRPPPLDVQEALRDLDGEVALALDGGRTRHSSASTIVEIRGSQWKLLRTGVLDERTIARMATTDYLFVCTGNSCRSPLAEFLFRSVLAERLGVAVNALAGMGYVSSSAGTYAYAGGPISNGSRDELSRRGIDASQHRSSPLTPELIQRSERIFAMSPEHLDAVLELAPGARGKAALLDPSGAIADPVGGSAADYRACADHIDRALRARIEELVNEDLDW